MNLPLIPYDYIFNYYTQCSIIWIQLTPSNHPRPITNKKSLPLLFLEQIVPLGEEDLVDVTLEIPVLEYLIEEG